MKNKIYSFKYALIFSGLLLSGLASAQVVLHQLEGFGVAIYDINNQGKGIHGNGYYDFATNESSVTEEGVVQTSAINDAEQVLGLIDDGEGNFIPAYRNEGTWEAFSNMDGNYTYTIYDLSENGIYAVGQTSNDAFESWPFIYNVETQTLTVLSSELYEYGAAYGVNDNGIAVGWVDDLPVGTVRMPAYFKEDGTIVVIREQYGEANGINENDEITGVYESQPFTYKIDSEEFNIYSIPDEYLSASFADISDNGISVGYAETYIEGQGFSRTPIIYQASLGEQPQLLKDVLTDLDIDASTLEGIAYRISSDGNYVAGWGNGPAFMAPGWALFLDDQLAVSDVDNSIDFTYYPNPVNDILHINSKSNVETVTVYNLAGQAVLNNVKLNNNTISLSQLPSGTYIVKMLLTDGKTNTFKILKK